jgi:hypothetical protein
MSLAKLKTRLPEIQGKIPQQLVRAASILFEIRYGAVVKERGEIFEIN